MKEYFDILKYYRVVVKTLIIYIIICKNVSDFIEKKKEMVSLSLYIYI